MGRGALPTAQPHCTSWHRALAVHSLWGWLSAASFPKALELTFSVSQRPISSIPQFPKHTAKLLTITRISTYDLAAEATNPFGLRAMSHPQTTDQLQGKSSSLIHLSLDRCSSMPHSTPSYSDSSEVLPRVPAIPSATHPSSPTVLRLLAQRLWLPSLL